MESRSLTYWCESLYRYRRVRRYLTKLGLWGKIVSYRMTNSQRAKAKILSVLISKPLSFWMRTTDFWRNWGEKSAIIPKAEMQDTQKCLCAQQHSEVVWNDSDTKSLSTGQPKWHNITTYCHFIESSTYELLLICANIFRYSCYVAEGYMWTDITLKKRKKAAWIITFEEFPTMFRNV